MGSGEFLALWQPLGWGGSEWKQLSNPLDTGVQKPTAMAAGALGTNIILGFQSGTILVYSVDDEQTSALITGHSAAVTCLAYDDKTSPHRIASGHSSGFLNLWSEDSRSLLKKMVGHSKDIIAFDTAWSQDRLATASLDGTARVWDLQTGNALRILQSQNALHSVSVAWPSQHALTG